MRNNKLIVVFGASGSGKDTFAQLLMNKYHCLERKFAAPMKRVIEGWYCLEPNVLDTQEGKAMPLPGGSGKTFGDLLVGCYHFWQQYDDAMTARGVARDIEHLLVTSPWSVVVTDLRKKCEAELVLEVVKRSGALLVLVSIWGRGELLSSDREQAWCEDYLYENYGIRPYRINNSGSKDDLVNEVQEFVNSL